jgi:outer membrane protein insertion porin family
MPSRASLVRATEEAVATLGPFASVNVALDNPYIPQKNKTVIVTVVERRPKYVDAGAGFATGEGFRLSGEFGHRNLWGNAISLTVRLQLAYIPTPLILDEVAKKNYGDLDVENRIAARLTASLAFPEIGLGPLFRAGLDTLGVQDLQRDFYLQRAAAIPNLSWRPRAQVQATLSQSAEFNANRIFQSGNILEYLQSRAFQGQNVTDLARQLSVPDGDTYAFAQRLLVSWDRRDNAPNASHGTFVSFAVEHVDAFPTTGNLRSDGTRPPESHFVKLTPSFSGYIPLPKGIRFAAHTRFGFNYQLTDASATYPDRLFFMGGVDTMRGWNLNSFIPQDDVDRIFADREKPDFVGVQFVPSRAGSSVSTSPPNAAPAEAVRNIGKFTPATRPLRGGNLMVLQRLEFRIPIKGPFETVLFTDIGNLWIDPAYPFTKGKLPMRANVGSGLRVQTPVGPLAVDYGINVDPEPYEDFGAINFAIGLF